MKSRYELLRGKVGTGGAGTIDKAWDTKLDRPVAIKTLAPVFKDRPSAADFERFLREAKTLASLSHPYIPAIYDIDGGEPEKELKLIEQWIEGETVREVLLRQGRLSFKQVKKWLTQICSALGQAHRQGIIHRDIKPSNLIVAKKNGLSSCSLVDFGISLRQTDWYQRLTPSAEKPIGTP